MVVDISIHFDLAVKLKLLFSSRFSKLCFIFSPNGFFLGNCGLEEGTTENLFALA